VVADNSFAVIELLAKMTVLNETICMIVRFRLDVALYEPAPERREGQKGRQRKKGARLPTLQQMAENPQTRWEMMTIPDWYGQRDRKVEIVSSKATWYHSGKPAVPIRWILIRDPLGSFRIQAVLCTDLEVNSIQILLWFIFRCRVEVTFHEVRDHLGMETQRQWTDKSLLASPRLC